MLRTFLSLASVVTLAPVLLAQGPPGTNLTVEIRIPSLTLGAEATRIEYVVKNADQSQENLFDFTVEAPSPVIRIESPGPATDWYTTTTVKTVSAASWSMLDIQPPPGTATPPLAFEAAGLPGIVTYWAGGWFPVGPLEEEEEPPPPQSPREAIAAGAVEGRTVGIDPFPADGSPSALLQRLQGLLSTACGSLGWINSSAVCSSLSGKLQQAAVAVTQGNNGGARAQLESLIAEVAGQHPTGPVNDEAFWLLKINADYIISLIPGAVAPILHWTPPPTIVLGTPLSGTQLNATATNAGGSPVAGSFAYNPAAGTVLPAGAAQTLSVVFTPADPATFTGGSTSVPIDVRYNPAVGHRFLQPINTPPQDRSVFHLGSTVPVKFELFRADGVTTVTTAAATIQVNRISNGAPDPINESVVSTVPDQGTNFRYTGGHYQFNLGTGNLTTGTYRITALLNDGSTIFQDVELRSH